MRVRVPGRNTDALEQAAIALLSHEATVEFMAMYRMRGSDAGAQRDIVEALLAIPERLRHAAIAMPADLDPFAPMVSAMFGAFRDGEIPMRFRNLCTIVSVVYGLEPRTISSACERAITKLRMSKAAIALMRQHDEPDEDTHVDLNDRWYE